MTAEGDSPTRTGPKRSLIIPMKDESARLPATVASIASSTLAHGTELIFVDDGSVDATADLAERLVTDYDLDATVVRLPRNVGKGGAVQAGVRIATGASVAFCDADLSAGPEAIATAFETIEGGGADVVVTTRLHAQSTITKLPPWGRRLSGKAFNAFLRRLGLTAFDDTQCGLKVFSDKAATLLFRDLRIQRFAFDVELLLRADLAGLRVVELPIEWAHVEDSRVRTLRDGARMIVDVLRLRRSIGAWRIDGDPAATHDELLPVVARLEREHWWFAARRELVRHELQRVGTQATVLEVGCGTGATVDALGECARFAMGCDRDAHALAYARTTTVDPFVASSAERLPLADGAVNHVVSLDVIANLDDDAAALGEYARVAGPGGVVVISVPAYMWAWSDHDVALGHRRRYTRASLGRVATSAGLAVENMSYFHAWLVPVALMLRRTALRRVIRMAPEEASFVTPTINRALVALTAGERRLMQRVPLPFGLSILLVARVPASR